MFVPLVALSTGLSAAMGIMGAIGIGVVVLSILFLPETAGRELHDLDALEEPVATAGPVAPAE